MNSTRFHRTTSKRDLEDKMLGTIENKQVKFKRINAAIPVEWFKILKSKAENNDLTLSQILRMALQSYFSNELRNG